MSETFPFFAGNTLSQRFLALDAFLLEHRRLWRPHPFDEPTLVWEVERAELTSWLRGCSLEQVDAEHNQPTRLTAPTPHPRLAAQAAALGTVGELPLAERPQTSSRLNIGVPGRKWQQIGLFARRLQFARPVVHWLDWCSGKGHLGRLLTHAGQPLTCLEHDPTLVTNGQHLNDHLELSAHRLRRDVLAVDRAKHLLPGHTPMTLRACGELHLRLLRLANQTGCRQLAVAPYCYNRVPRPFYQPLSQAAGRSLFALSLDSLRLPLSETVTASQWVYRQHDQSMARHLDFDLLRRELREIDQYLSVPSLPVAWLKRPCASYYRELATLKGLPEPTARDWQALEAASWKCLAMVHNLELVRALFRRPLELWLLLDHCLCLIERGYNIRLDEFCPTSLSPRNLLVPAELS